MSKICEVCGKAPSAGRSISHSHRVTNRMFRPNVQKITIRDEKGQFLDDITLEELGRALGCRAVSIPTDGGGCCKAMLSTHKRKTIKFKR